MNKRYFVKTRNWHCNKWIKPFLDVSKTWGIKRGDSYTDGDGKYILETNSYLKAFVTWLYFMVFYRLTGGWTYVADASKNYRNILDSDKEL